MTFFLKSWVCRSGTRFARCPQRSPLMAYATGTPLAFRGSFGVHGLSEGCDGECSGFQRCFAEASPSATHECVPQLASGISTAFPPTRVAHGRKCSRGCRSDGVPPPAGKTKDRSWHAAPLTTRSFCGYQPAFYSFESYAGREGPLTEFKPPLIYREKDRETVREIYRR